LAEVLTTQFYTWQIAVSCHHQVTGDLRLQSTGPRVK